jgi:uncharacterized protein YukE
MGTQVYTNFKAFCKKKKKKSEEVWSRSTHPTMNNHLKQFKAKVFRTYNASKTLQDELRHRRVSLEKSDGIAKGN